MRRGDGAQTATRILALSQRACGLAQALLASRFGQNYSSMQRRRRSDSYNLVPAAVGRASLPAEMTARLPGVLRVRAFLYPQRLEGRVNDLSPLFL
jgi:hypothetical protein